MVLSGADVVAIISNISGSTTMSPSTYCARSPSMDHAGTAPAGAMSVSRLGPVASPQIQMKRRPGVPLQVHREDEEFVSTEPSSQRYLVGKVARPPPRLMVGAHLVEAVPGPCGCDRVRAPPFLVKLCCGPCTVWNYENDCTDNFLFSLVPLAGCPVFSAFVWQPPLIGQGVRTKKIFVPIHLSLDTSGKRRREWEQQQDEGEDLLHDEADAAGSSTNRDGRTTRAPEGQSRGGLDSDEEVEVVVHRLPRYERFSNVAKVFVDRLSSLFVDLMSEPATVSWERGGETEDMRGHSMRQTISLNPSVVPQHNHAPPTKH